MPTVISESGNSCIYCTKLTFEQTQALYKLCLARHFEEYKVLHANFAFKGNKLNLVVYETGKLVIQGKNTNDFVQFELEPNITFQATLGYDEALHPEWFEDHAGLDESGKGDLFGPLVTACVVAGENAIKKWVKGGVRDSKVVGSDKKIFALESLILQSDCKTHVMALSMEKYNELYGKFGRNLNILLGWMHACTLQKALRKRFVPWGMLDQFSKVPIVQRFLKETSFDLRMQVKAEADPVVAAASILARAEYSRQMSVLSQKAGFELSKGAGKAIVEQANKIVEKFGYEALPKFVKVHFATAPRKADI